MKKFTLIRAATLMYANAHFARSCLGDGITLYDQQSIDNFPADYLDCIEIPGDVTIGLDYDNNITDLNSLSNIQHIEGFLYIQENPNLENMDGPCHRWISATATGSIGSTRNFFKSINFFKLQTIFGFFRS